jgi:hypothetical protein
VPRPSSKSSPGVSPPTVDAEFREVPAPPAGSPARSPVHLQVRRVRVGMAVPAKTRPRATAMALGSCPFCNRPGDLGDVSLPLGMSVKACKRCGAIGQLAVRLGGLLLR